MILVRQLSKKYGMKKVVDDLSLEVHQGEVLGFIGPNGAGKSTSMKMICGVMPYAEPGLVRIGGFDMASEPVKAKSILGYLPENAPLFASMTVRTFLKYCARMHGIPAREQGAALERAVQACSLESVLNEELDALSKGYKRRVCLAQTIMHQPKALILDEPTDGLDPNQKREIRSLIRMMRHHSAIIVSTHILEEIESVCDRVLVLSRGKKVFDDTTEAFRAAAPENGVIHLRLAPGSASELHAALVQNFPNAEFPSFRIDSGVLEISMKHKNGTPEELLSMIYRYAQNQNLKITSCDIMRGRFESIFAQLSGADESSKGGMEQ